MLSSDGQSEMVADCGGETEWMFFAQLPVEMAELLEVLPHALVGRLPLVSEHCSVHLIAA